MARMNADGGEMVAGGWKTADTGGERRKEFGTLMDFANGRNLG
jgi:hypothetical protein